MEAFWTTVLPAIAGAIAVGLPILLRLLASHVQLQEQAARSAVAHVDAVGEPAVNLTRAQAKREALRLMAEQLPANRVPNHAQMSAQIERAVAEKRAEHAGRSTNPGALTK